MSNSLYRLCKLIPRYWLATFASVVVSWIAVVWIFWGTVLSMVNVWLGSESFVHGFLILPISLYLIWTQRLRIAPMIPRPNSLGLFFLAAFGLGWFLGHLIDTVVVEEFALIAMLLGLVWTLTGSEVTRTILFPLAFLFFAVPVGQGLDPLLQDFTAFCTVSSLKLSGVPIVWEGRTLYLHTSTWHVAKACSGLRYLIAAVALGYLFAFISYRSWIRRISFILSAAVLAILCNSLRAYGIIMLAYLKIIYLDGPKHHIFGMIIFGIMMLLLCWFGLHWRESLGYGKQVSPGNLRPVSMNGNKGTITCSARKAGIMAVSSIVILAIAPFAASTLANRELTPVVVKATTPNVSLPWKMMAEFIGGWEPYFPDANAEVMQSFTDESSFVHLYIAYYSRQSQGGELISPKNTIAHKKKWTRLTEGQGEAKIDGKVRKVQEITMRSLQRTCLVWSWYWVDGQFTSSPYIFKLLQLKARFLGRPDEAAVIAIGTDYDDQKDDAFVQLQGFLNKTAIMKTLNSFSTPK